MLKRDPGKSTKKEIILQINYLYNLDRITVQKVQVIPSSVKHKNIRRGIIFGRPDTLTILTKLQSVVTFQAMTACVVIDFILVMTASKIIPLHKMRLLIVTEVEKLVTGHTL